MGTDEIRQQRADLRGAEANSEVGKCLIMRSDGGHMDV